MFVATALLTGTLVMGATSISAMGMGWGDNQSGLIDKIASAFKLDKTKVTKVVNDYRIGKQKEHQTEALTRLSERLAELVKDGKITDSQRILILNKHKELQAKKVADQSKLQAMTVEERKTYMETQRTALDTWAKQNGIDAKYALGFGKGHGMGGGRGMWRN